MKIAMIGQKGMPAIYGGVEKHVHDLSVRLVNAGHDVTVYSRKWYTEGEDGEINGVKIKHTPTIKTKHLDAITHTFFSTLHAIRQNYDIIHYHAVGPSLLCWIPRILAPKTKVITTFHCVDRYHQKWGWFARMVLRMGEWAACMFAHETITVSQSLRQYCENEFKSNTTYIPNAITIPERNIGFGELDQFGLESGKYFLMVSRLVPHKGAHLLIEAFTRIKKAYREDPEIADLKLAIVGGSAYTNDYVKELQRQAGACNEIVFTDFQKGQALEQLYANSCALVHPSMNEGLPITVLEAMSYGKPALVSNIPQHLEIVKDVRAVFVENDVQAIVEKMVDFLNLSLDERKEMGEVNQKRVTKEYTWDTIVPQVIEVYERQMKDKDTRTAEMAA